MKKIIKYFFIFLLVLVAFLIAAPFLFKGKIIALVKEKTNENLNAKVDFGEFDLSIISSFPDFRFEIENITVAGVNEFEKDTLANIGKIKLDLNIKSLISGGPYQINEIYVGNPKINAIVLENSKANWDIAKPSVDTVPEKPEEKKEETPFKLSLKSLQIENARISYDDRASKMHGLLDTLNFNLKGDFTQDNFLLNILLQIAQTSFKMSGVNYLTKASLNFKSDLDADMKAMKFTFKENEFYINDLGLKWDGFVAMPDSAINMDIKLSLLKADFKTILSLIPAIYTHDFKNLQAKGKIAFDAFAKGTYLGNQYPAFGLNLKVEDAMFKYPSLPKSVNNIQLDLAVSNKDGKPDNTLINLNKLHLEMAQNPIDLVAKVSTPVSDPNFFAKVIGKIDLSSVKEFIPLDKTDELNGIISSNIAVDGRMSYIDKNQYDKFQADGMLNIENMKYTTTAVAYPISIQTLNLQFSHAFVELKKFDGNLGKSDIHMAGRIDNFMGYLFRNEALKGKFTFNSDYLDLNELMGSSSSTSATPSSTSTSASTAASTSTAVAEVPGNIDFVLDSKLNKVIFQNMEISNIVGTIIVRDKKAILQNLKMNMLDGTLGLSGFYETPNSKTAKTGLNLNIDHFDIQKAFITFNTMQQLAPAAKYAKGFFSTTLENFNVLLNEKMEPDLKSVNAKGTLRTKEITVGGLPALVKLGEALKMDQLKETKVSDLNLTYQIKDGRIYFDPFKTKINQIPVEITGSTGLDQTIDYKWNMEIPRSMLGNQANQALAGLLNKANAAAGTNVQLGEKINVNVLFGGTVTNPTVKTGLKESAQSAVSTVTTQAYNAAVDKAAEEAQKILNEAQAQVDKLRAETAAQIEKIRQEGYAAADKLVEEAKNPLEKMAAKKAAETAKKKVDEQCKKLNDETEAKCNKIMEEARAKAQAKAEEAKK
ncbi:MAG: membrane assembly protein AsmA [Bacteroidia bacterium]|nr:membrane assembly protein AsmA [Bacteroidia bacterium]